MSLSDALEFESLCANYNVRMPVSDLGWQPIPSIVCLCKRCMPVCSLCANAMIKQSVSHISYVLCIPFTFP